MPSSDIYRAAVIGLGQIGFRLQLDPKRTTIWSHSHAYQACPRTVLTAAIEIDPEKIGPFQAVFPDVPVYGSISEVLARQQIDIVSICTPTATHEALFSAVATGGVRAVFAEKPLAANLEEAARMVGLVREKNLVTALNHTRRWQVGYRMAAEIISQGRIGRIMAVQALYPGQIFNIGTHLFDTLRMLIGQNPIMASGSIVSPPNALDPSFSGQLLFPDSIFCGFAATGRREDLIFEIDIIGREGRVQIKQNGQEVRLYQFRTSPRYSGYRELLEETVPPVDQNDALLDALEDLVRAMDGEVNQPACTVLDGYWTLAMITALSESARQGGTPVSVTGPPL